LDYLRAHRLALVWMGYRMSELRAIRADSIGTERMPGPGDSQPAIELLSPLLGAIDELPLRTRGMINRFLIDLSSVLGEIRRVLKSTGHATFVVGNSCIRNVFIDNAAAVVAAAKSLGFTLVERKEREIPPARRYLPPPSVTDTSGVKNRMRAEVILTFAA
jgi:hypothetical protein